MRHENFPIAPEGFPFIIAAGFAVMFFAFLSWKIIAVIAFGLTLFIIYFFRNPERSLPEDERGVIAPADGVIIYLGPSREEHLGEEMTKVSIFMSVFNVHVNRAPISGEVLEYFYNSGKFLDVRDERATFENERSGLVLKDPEGRRIVVVQVAGLIARRIVCYLKKGDMAVRGKRYGLIRFGSRLDVYMPLNSDLMVKLGDKTVAGETVLGYLH
jgi:phosphatidylserine decarboxylase